MEQLRDNKARLKKIKRAIGKRDFSRAEQLKASKPDFKVDHIIKERYPSFLDALRDLDDALCMIHLFAMLPTKTVPYHDAKVADLCVRLVRYLLLSLLRFTSLVILLIHHFGFARLCSEFQSYVFHTHALRKMFVSIKGMYYQAEIQGQTITWLVPHKFSPNV